MIIAGEIAPTAEWLATCIPHPSDPYPSPRSWRPTNLEKKPAGSDKPFPPRRSFNLPCSTVPPQRGVQALHGTGKWSTYCILPCVGVDRLYASVSRFALRGKLSGGLVGTTGRWTEWRAYTGLQCKSDRWFTLAMRAKRVDKNL